MAEVIVNSNIKSIYIHFPFCESRCHYCDFYALGKDKTKPEDISTFEHALYLELLKATQNNLISHSLDTLFFGGGTPSMTSPQSMEKILAPLWTHSSLHNETEWTIEVNPSSVNKDKMVEYKKLGVNRVSMGVQSLDNGLLKTLGRVHSQNQALTSLESVFASGISNVSVDLLCGVPNQTLADLDNSLKQLTSFPITHLSCYLLTLSKHHKMFPQLPNEDEQLKHLLFIHDWLEQNGFEHYEISNFAKRGFQAKHNLRYWNRNSYLGFGPSAHSYLDSTQSRWKNISSLKQYTSKLYNDQSVIEWKETLNELEQNTEKWMLSFRLAEGFPKSWIQSKDKLNKLNQFIESKYIEPHPIKENHLKLTPTGFSICDQIVVDLMS